MFFQPDRIRDAVVKKYKPKFFRNWKIFSLTFGSLLKNKNFLNTNPIGPKEFISPPSFFNIIQLRHRLLLYKLVCFDKHYYSTPTIPAFPSQAYDNMVLKGGLNFLSAGTQMKKQIDSVFLAITNKCELKCGYCYERQNINKTFDIPSTKWNEIIKTLQSIGVNIFILSGGEPLQNFDRLIDILNSADKNQSDFHLHTSGNSVTWEKVKKLKDSGLKAAAVGLDDFDGERHDKIRGKGSFNDAIKALKLFNEAGILTYVNFCASKNMLQSDYLYRYYELVRGLNVAMIQLLEPRPCGGYFNNGSDVWLNAEDKKKLFEFTRNGNRNRAYKNYPLIYYVAHIEGMDQLGCHMGGLSHFYIDSKGNVCPCVFFPIKYGNIIEEDILSIFKRMRNNLPSPLYTVCPSLLLADKCREFYDEQKQIPIPFEQVQKHIDNLYREQQNNSISFLHPNKEIRTERAIK